MVNKNELKCGNQVYMGTKEKVITVVKNISDTGINSEWHDDEDMTAEGVEHELFFSEEKFEDLYPIPLTPEILLKCQFKFFDKTSYWKKEYSYRMAGIRLHLNNNTGEFYFYISTGAKIVVKHLHQLQNLYFDLTGEELNVEL